MSEAIKELGTGGNSGQKPDKRRTRRNSTEQDMLKAVRTAERTAGNGADIGGTGYTILKMRRTPVERLVDEHRIGQEELQAAEDIAKAFAIIASPVMMRSIGYERVDCANGGRGAAPPVSRSARLVHRYQQWANHWSRLDKLASDPMLEVVVSAVIDERQIGDIAQDIGRRYSLVKAGLVAGLRDYAAHAEFITGARAIAWRHAASLVFTAVNPRLIGAIRRARVEI